MSAESTHANRRCAGALGWMACLLVCLISPSAGASEARLPDGTNFVFWEQPLKFSKTYYVDANSSASSDEGAGTQEHPFRTISKAAEILQPGERVVIASGEYRECIRPARGGTGPDKMISYEAAPGATVVVKASEVLRNWEPSVRTVRGNDQGNVKIWEHALSGAMFPDAYNPFALANVPGDWIWLNTKSVDMGPYFRRRGMIFVDGRPLEPVEQYRELLSTALPGSPDAPTPPTRSGLPSRARGAPIMQEVGGSPEGRFWIEHQGNVLHIRVASGDPNTSLVEVTTREQAFVPQVAGLGYIRIKGITFQHAGNAFPPPQRGLVSTNGGNHWIIEGNTIEWANGVGLDIGNKDWNFAPAPMAGESHIVRGNTIRYIGVEGLGGMGTKDTLIEDNLIEWVGWQDAERAWEAAGAKFHFSRNLLFRRNVIRHIRHANALWLDSGNQNSRVTGNVFADVVSVSAAIHMEMNRAENQIDNNIIWDVRNAEPGTPGQRGAAGSGIFLHASEKQIVAQNLIGRCDNVGVYSVLRPERNGAGNGRDHQIDNNIFAGCNNGGVVFVDEQNQSDGNTYAGSPQRVGGLGTTDAVRWFDFTAWQSHGWDRHGSVSDLEVQVDPDRLELTVNHDSKFNKVPVFDHIDSDLFGNRTRSKRYPGPLSDFGRSRVISIDPRHQTQQ